MRTIAAVAFIALAGRALHAWASSPNVNVGDHLAIRMTGDLAREYARRTGSLRQNEVPTGLQISTTAAVEQVRDDGKIRIEHSSSIMRNGKPARLVTLTAIVHPAKITTHVTPENTPIYRSPADYQRGVKPTVTRKVSEIRRLDLSDLRGLKLRVWRPWIASGCHPGLQSSGT